ncbi:hypothetical protein CU097_011971 [Rhizopus azygosporus]|uniref:Uncharacterized protein n=1 Tax=Rhizopus azygosporus TaxID=86630 RepID=A0A367JHJ6_RHIAZ|nr:hypothetical protein CU097_011971 [Rhizopus azygosporus]
MVKKKKEYISEVEATPCRSCKHSTPYAIKPLAIISMQSPKAWHNLIREVSTPTKLLALRDLFEAQ